MLVKFLSTILMFSLIQASPTFAQATKAKSKKRTPNSSKDAGANFSEGEESPESNSNSRSARGYGKVGADLLYTPASDFILSYGASGSYSMSSDLQVGGFFLLGNESKSFGQSDSTSSLTLDAKYSGFAAAATGRYFFGSNSFNVMSGLGYRTAKIDYTIVDSTSTLNMDGSLSIQSVILPLFIGNRWSWPGGFTLGCDWIGVMIALSGSAKSELSGKDSGLTKLLNDKILEEGDRLAKTNSLTLLLTSIGWAF